MTYRQQARNLTANSVYLLKMFTPPIIPVAVMDGWPLAESGLPVRVVNSARSAGLHTVGDLRALAVEDLLGLRAMGRSSVRDLQHFVDRCAEMATGKRSFLTVQEVLEQLLNGEEWEVVRCRYGLMRSDGRIDRKFMTLQEIGNQFRLTRERIRQVEVSAFQQLRSRLAEAYLAPFHHYLRTFVKHHKGIAGVDEIATLRGQFWIGEDDPGSFMLLLHDVDPTRMTWHRNLFSLWPATQLDQWESAAYTLLHQHPHPVALAQLAAVLPELQPEALERVLAQSPRIMTTLDHRFFLPDRGGDALLAERATDAVEARHYREWTDVFNEQIRPHQRKGSGFVLKLLGSSSRFQRTERGRYRLWPRT